MTGKKRDRRRTHSEQDSTVVKATGWYGAGYVASTACFLAVNGIAARILGLAKYGPFVTVVTICVAVIPIGLLGASRSAMRDGASAVGVSPDVFSRIKAQLRIVERVSLPITSIAAGVAATFVVGGAQRFSLLLSTTLFAYVCAQQRMVADVLRGAGDHRWAALIVGRVSGPLTAFLQLAVLAALYSAHVPLTVTQTLLVLTLASLPAQALGMARLRRVWAHHRVGHIKVRAISELLDGWRFAVVQVAGEASQSVELWIAASVLTAADTSLFGAANRVSTLVASSLVILQVVFGPLIARMWSHGRKQELETLLRSAASLVSALAFCAWLPLVVIPGWVLTIAFGSHFAAGGIVLGLLATGALGNVASGLCGTCLVMTHHDAVAARVQVAALVARLGLGLAFGSAMGLTGLGISSCLVTIAVNITNWYLVRRLLDLDTRPLIRPSLESLRSARA